MGQGASCFRGEQFVCAINAFSRAAWLASDDQQRGAAAFNLANSYFKQGDFTSAITLFEDALTYQPEQTRYQQNLSFSEEVQRQIELRLKQEAASANRRAAGAGIRAINVENNTVVTPNMRLTLDKAPPDTMLSQANVINFSEKQLIEFMQRSQMFATAGSGKSESRQMQHDWQRFSNEDPTVARQLDFWQRLFEMEEGILTHPNAPKLLPGVQPW
jgi:tetratricopeptide (TPR) repeat protein